MQHHTGRPPEHRAIDPEGDEQPSRQILRMQGCTESGEVQFASEFLEQYLTDGHYLRENIDGLGRLATCGNESQEGRATTAIFQSLVEPLSESFNPDSARLYIRVMAQLIQHCRKEDSGLDRELVDFGLVAEEDIIVRAEGLRPVAAPVAAVRPTRHCLGGPNSVKRVVILSRVTIGADVAITSVLVERLKQKFPTASLTLAGGVKVREIFGADPRLDFAELEYGRRATLMDRMRAWVDLVQLIGHATAGLSSDEFLVVDPDSRLTQLGMLPVVAAPNYLFFPSREYMSSSVDSLARLASDWSREVLGLADDQLPAIAISPRHTNLASNLVKSLRSEKSSPVVSVNFGVGDNEEKRVGMEFEAAILEFLLDHKAGVILDRGAGPRENSSTDSLVARLAGSGSESLESSETLERPARECVALDADEEKLKAICRGKHRNTDLLIFKGRLGLLAALIAESDLYIGYDSAGGHIAAAAGTPCIDIFAGYTSSRMTDRWRPTGRGTATVIDAFAGRSVSETIEEAKTAALKYLRS